MPQRSLVGSRIRQRRIALGVRQAALARQIGISASYLNLIEHNKRRIAGKLVVDFASALETDVTSLSEGAEETLVTGLREAQSQYADAAALEPAEDLTGRFPGWSGLIAAQQARIADLERSVEGLTDRITHDPFLSQSLHDVLSSVTAIRSTSSILRESKDLEPDWQARFHNNLYEDAVRLADSSQNLVHYLDASDGSEASVVSPLEEFEDYLEHKGFHLEDPSDPPKSLSPEAQSLVDDYAATYAVDARALPSAQMQAALAQYGPDPAAISAAFHLGFAQTLRRMAAVLAHQGQPVGLVVCDASGTFTYRQPVEGFVVPRFGAACALWPLFTAFSTPRQPQRSITQFAGRGSPAFVTYAVAEPVAPFAFSGPNVLHATMLILPLPEGEQAPIDQVVGSSCRICPKDTCPARREPTILEV
ncbi:short-chain fatty acyl-CoA regulator family protein [Algirhabdus cladophorae]|uniref:short-chain fatty acyl-CoA regulator family protein n=1 Tax=Algirhabdus cladophorae TaxID=3377108 RepID=UPI003B848C6F